jgi:Ca2+-binding EF-hand superfamily protein
VEQVRAAFNSYDKDKSGTLSREEFSSFANDLFNIMREGMDSAELLEKYTPKHFAATLFSKLDMDRNGKITFEEFQNALKNI